MVLWYVSCDHKIFQSEVSLLNNWYISSTLYSKPSSNTGIRFLKKGALGKSMLDKLIPYGLNEETGMWSLIPSEWPYLYCM
jgi:hypothetical protein